MAQALFITPKDIKQSSIVNGSVDADKFIQFVKISQDIHIQGLLGTDLYEKIEADILASSLTGNYLTLVTDYVKPVLIHYSMVDYLPFAAYQIGNGGFVKVSNENGETLSTNEVDKIAEKHRKFAQFYAERLIDYLRYNQSLFPEYNTNSNGDIRPDSEINGIGWVL